MRAERGVEIGPLVNESARQAFVIRIGMALLREDRAEVAAQARLDHLVIPVGALHQTDGERSSTLMAKGGEAVEIVARGFEIGLDHDAEMRPPGKFRIERDPLEEAVGDFVQVPLLEIEVDEGAEFLRALQQGAHTLQQPLHAAVWIGRVEEVVHRGKFERNIGARDGTAGPPVENRIGAPSGRLAGKKTDQVGITLRIGGRFGRVDRGLAEEIDRETETVVP